MKVGETVNNNKAVFGDIVYRPVDRRENYVKRCIGMPGDNFEVRNNQVYIDGKPLKNPKEMQLNYYIMTSSPDIRLGEANFRELNVSEDVVSSLAEIVVMIMFLNIWVSREMPIWDSIRFIVSPLLKKL